MVNASFFSTYSACVDFSAEKIESLQITNTAFILVVERPHYELNLVLPYQMIVSTYVINKRQMFII